MTGLMLSDPHRERGFSRVPWGTTSVLPFPCRATLGPLGRLAARARIAYQSTATDVRTALGLVALNVAAMTAAAML